MKKYKNFLRKMKIFVIRNNYIFVVGFCLLAIVSAVAITAFVKYNKSQNIVNEIANIDIIPDFEDSAIAVSTSKPIVFVSPVANYTLGMTYAENELLYNSTLNEWSTHLGVDFIAERGTSVVAVYAGVVESVTYNILDGTVITIKHNDTLTTIYKSLGQDSEVLVGDKVAQGQVIGRVSDSATSESRQGPHLHFEVIEKGVHIDPSKYLANSTK